MIDTDEIMCYLCLCFPAEFFFSLFLSLWLRKVTKTNSMKVKPTSFLGESCIVTPNSFVVGINSYFNEWKNEIVEYFQNKHTVKTTSTNKNSAPNLIRFVTWFNYRSHLYNQGATLEEMHFIKFLFLILGCFPFTCNKWPFYYFLN